ncbi:DinB family protein [Deinococcus sp.]|uniref:DinB family protein n=1 Tax=Deinococcus sp. TaxID=47478 RepID=UPI00286992F1|nr:DinB family protein [Deinococcus sp.]
MTQDSNPQDQQHPIDSILGILKEAAEGGTPGQGTAFLDGTKADGSGNHVLLATLDSVDAVQASHDVNGTSIAGQARHAAFHLEVIVRWERDGDRGPFDWKGSFLHEQVNAAEWTTLRERVKAAYEDVMAFAGSRRDAPVDGDMTGGLAGAVAHVAYHLGAIRQMVKIVS